MKIGERIRRIRQEKQLSADYLAMRIGEHNCCLSCIENGDKFPHIETLKEIAEALDVPPHRLFYDGNAPPPLPNLPGRLTSDDIVERSQNKDAPIQNSARLSLRTL